MTGENTAAEDRVGLMRHGFVSMLGPVLTGLIGVVLVPLMLGGLGGEQYGVYVLTLTVATWCAALADMGIHLAVVREVAATGRDGDGGDAVNFLASAATLYLAISVVTACAVAGSGLLLGRLPGVSSATRATMPAVFVLAAVGFVFSQVFAFHAVILQGLRRFALYTLLSTASVAVSAVGVVAALSAGGGLPAVMAVQAVTAALSAVAARLTVTRLMPQFRQRGWRFVWPAVRSRLRFSVHSHLIVLANAAMWEGLPLLVGGLCGPVALVPFHLGRRFPLAISALVWNSAAVAMPAASEHERTGDSRRAGEGLEAATRWVVVSSLPLYLVLWIVGPRLLDVWLGQVPQDAVAVLRILTAAVALRAFGEAAAGVLWGRGVLQVLLAVTCGETAAVLALAALLLPAAGVPGAAWAVALVTPAATAAILLAAARACGVSSVRLARNVTSRLMLPVAACIAVTGTVLRFAALRGWPAVLAAGAAGAVSYVAVFSRFAAHEEERMFMARGVASLADLFFGATALVYRGVRVGTKAFGFRAARYPGLTAIVGTITEPYEQPEAFDRDYEVRPDHWGYTSNPIERERFDIALRMLDDVRGAGRLGRVMEIACAEGVFTELLAPRCDSLLAVDFSEIALARARERCASAEHVSFGRWNLRTDPIPGPFDVIVVMDVLTLIRRPDRLRAVMRKLTDALRPGDFLLACDYRQKEALRPLEHSPIGRYLLFGGKWVLEALAARPGLETVQRASTESHVLALFRKG